MGAEATETVIQESNAPLILHIATHGYYLSHPSEFSEECRLLTEPHRFDVYSENPMRRSGLVFAGVNRALDGGRAPDHPQDGIFDANDVLSLSLHGTEIVVLSTCMSGMGDVEDGEGVAGLRRAFIIAGARAVVCSMWAVSDWGTKDMMDAFYRHLTEGLGAGAALDAARSELREHGAPVSVWAAFICVGNPDAAKGLFPRNSN
jgi:CHAT domain-containing protein